MHSSTDHLMVRIHRIPHERSGKLWVTTMETFLDHAGWDHRYTEIQ